MTLKKIVLVLMFLCGSSTTLFAQLPPRAVHKVNARFERFKSLNGPDQVQMFFKEAFGKGMFRKQFTALPFDLSFEEQILVSSPNSTINTALALKAKQPDITRARYAVYLICMRARFVPHSEFPIKHVAADYALEYGSPGRITPFTPNFDRVGKEASDAVKEALASPNMKLQTTAKLYSGELEKELALRPASELAMRWRSEIGKLPAPIYYFENATETGELVRVLKRVLGSKGLDAAVAIAAMLEKESKPWARELEIELIEFIDESSVRLRGSEQGKDVIRLVEKIFATQKHWFVYDSKEARQEHWQTLQDRFFKDHDAGFDLWGSFLGLAFEQIYNEHVTVSDRYGNKFLPRIDAFVSYLTEIDPRFPSWEFPSTASQNDMLHPQFATKVARYHEAWVKMNSTH